MKTRSVELPRRQRSSSYTTGMAPQSSTGTQGLNPQQPPVQPQGPAAPSLPNQMPNQTTPNQVSGTAQATGGLLQTSTGAWTGPGGQGGVGPRPPQPVTPPQQQPGAEGHAQDQVRAHFDLGGCMVDKP